MPLTKVNSQQLENNIDLAGAPKNDGLDLGYKIIPQNPQTSSYTLALSDSSKHIYHTGAAATITIPTNSLVAFPIGTAISIINNGSGALTISTTGITAKFAGTVLTGNRTVAVNGMASLIKVASDTWFISGVGVS
jgi:hypothetical protein